MKRTMLSVLILITILLSTPWSVAAHEAPETAEGANADQPKIRNWMLRFGFVVAETSGSTTVSVDPGTVDVSLSGGGGGFVNLEYMATPLLGLEFGGTGIGADMNVSTHAGLKHIGAEVDVLGMSALTLAANFHFIRTKAINVYAGPMLAFNRYSQWSVYTGYDDEGWPAKHGHDEWVSVRSSSDSEFTWGAQMGIDITLTKKGNWTLGGSLAYLDATYDFDEISGEGQGSIDLNPIIFSFGAGFRF